MDRDLFIAAIASLDREQLSSYIKEKGKEPKMIKPFVVFPHDKSTNKQSKKGKK